MIDRKRGAIVLMSSLAGNQGTPRIATYAATKAFNRVLAEGLWYELRGRGIDIVACCAGAVRTPGYTSSSAKEAPGTMDPRRVAEIALRGLGHGPVAIPGFINRAAALLMTRILPRRAAIGIMAGSTSDLGQPNDREMTS
jgi:short-subunit dehydrogenase